MATAAAEAACVTCSTALCSSSTLSVDPMKRRSGSHRMDKTTPASRSEGSACTASYSGSAVLAEHHRTRPSVHGFGRGDSREARWTHRPRRALRLTKRAAVCVLYLLLPFLLYHSTPPSASQRLPPARASITAATASICAPFLFVRAVEYDLTLAFQTNDYVDNVCVPSATAPAAAIDLSACPYYPLWSLLAGVSSFGETARVDGGNVDAAAASRAGARGGVDSSTRPVERHGRAAAAEAEAEARRRIPTATSAAAPSAASTAYVVPGDLTSTLSGSRNALTYYYQVLNTDDFFFMLQGCTIQITIDGDVPPSYAYNSFQRYADAYALNVSATGKDGSISGGSGGRGSLAFPAGTRASDTEGDGDEAYPNITLRTAFFFWNQPRLHCAYNAPALMSMMVDLANQHHHHHQQQQQQQQRRAFLKDDAVLAEASAQPADGEVAAGRPVASSAGPLYPSCAASMPPPKNILPAGGRNTTLTVNYMQLGSSVVVKIFSFDVWYQLTGTPAPATLSKARTTTTAAPASAAYSAVFSSGPITRGRGCSTGVSTKNLAAGQSLKLPADPEKVCTAPALYTISLNPLLARASSWSLGSSTDWLQPSVMVTHDYPAARVIAVVAQCSGVPLSFSVKANFLNPGNYPGSGQHYATSIIHLFFLVCYALLLIVFLVMIVPCSKRRRRRRRGQGRQRRGGGAEGGESSSSPGQARSSDKKKRASAGSDESRGGSMRGRRSGSAAAGGDGGEEMHGTSAPSSTTTKYAAVAASSGPESTSAAVKNTTTAQRSPSSSSPTSAAAVAARTRASTQRGATESGQDNAEDEPLHREEGKSGRRQHRGGAGSRPQQQQQGQRVAERRNGGSEGDDSQPETSSLYTAHSNAHLTSSSGIYDDNDINCGSSDAASEVQARRGSSGRRRAQSRRRGGPSTLSLSTSGDDSDCSSSSSTTTTDSTSDDDGSRAARRRRRQKEQRRAKRERQEQKKQRSRPRHHVSATSTSRRYAANDLDDDRRGSSTGVVSAFASPLRWRFRAVGMTDVVGHQVLDPVRLWWAESHILVMYAPIQWLVLVLLVLRCLLSVLLAAKFFLLSRAVHRDSLMGNSLSLVCIIFEVATDTLLIPIEMLVAMGWGLAFTAPLPTNQIVTVGLATLTMFIVFVFSAACAKDGLSMALTANRYARLINGNLCNTVAYTRAAFEMVCRVHNVLRMFLLSLWLSKTVVPADAAAVQRQRRLSHRQLQGAQNECREGQGMAGPGDSSSDGVSCRSDLHRRTSSATSSSSSGQCDGSSLVTTFTTTDTTTPSSAPFALRPPPRLGYPGVSLSAMEVYLRYRGMWVPFAMLLVWAVLLLVFAFTFYEPEDYYMVVAFRELQSVYLLGFIILFLRTSSPLYC